MDFKDHPILCVDDSRTNRMVLDQILKEEFSVIIADSGKQALDILSKHPVSVLLTDQCMPEITGVDLAEKTYKAYPNIIRVIITAYSDLETTVDAINRGRVNRFIKKPWTQSELTAVMRESVLSYHNSQRTKQMQERLLSYERIASLGIMASGIAHDIRQPLFQIFQFIELLNDDISKIMDLDPEGSLRDLLQTMKQDLDDTTSAINALKLLSSSLLTQLNNRPLIKQPINIKELVEGVVAVVRFTVMRRAKLKFEFHEGQKDLYGCSSRLSQLILNLLLNAAQAIEDGRPYDNRIVLRVIPQVNHMLIEVEDTGQGILPENREKIFNLFFTTKEEAGSGLGLTICRRCVEEHNGTIEVSSIPGEGSCFKVALPLGYDA
ncbi:MAG: hybrid sensor histidine kinase/response regulator [Planctomycetes bacterium]|nr:hybrid sensor histidine kinase/response regulator [Planctomycetota bacterium]